MEKFLLCVLFVHLSVWLLHLHMVKNGQRLYLKFDLLNMHKKMKTFLVLRSFRSQEVH